jgi:Ca2+-binding RTX toxin-like protein
MRRTILTMATTMALTVLVVSGVALAANIACVVGATQCVGTSQNDHISGSQQDDTIFARHGDDTVNGNDGHDEIHGGPGNDTLNGNDVGDTFFGDGGADTLEGALGADNNSGGRGNDSIDASDPNDPAVFEVSVGGRGNDTIDTVDGHADHIGCGEGEDTVNADVNDTIFGVAVGSQPDPIADCEHVNVG